MYAALMCNGLAAQSTVSAMKPLYPEQYMIVGTFVETRPHTPLMTHVFHRNPRQPLAVAVRGQGIELFDQNGKSYIDASGGAAVSCLGHGHPAVIQAIKDQLDQIAYAHSSFFTTQVSEELANFLSERAPGDLDHVYFVSGGSEAVEAALKLARQYFIEAGQPSRRHFIARRQSYHGNTLGALAIGGNAWRREPFLPLLVPASHVSPCYAYRDQHPGETEEHYAERLANELDDAIGQLGPENVAAFVAETVGGATAGALLPVATYLQRVREVCDRHGVLLILDEVMSGMGRTGHLFACSEDGVVPDIITVAKGLGAGYQPIGAMLASARIYDTIVAGTGFFQHGHTYMGHATACAAALAVQQTIEREQLLPNVWARGEQLRAELRATLGDHPNVGDIRGRGLFVGVELVQDRQSKATLDPALKIHAKLKNQAMLEGLMTYPMGGTVDGVRGDHVLLAPPFICTPADISEIVSRFASTVNRVLPA
jgi:adenosylmethionine-8-amino-7-oxononanoate aminotransferase